MTYAEHRANFELLNYILYLTILDELWVTVMHNLEFTISYGINLYRSWVSSWYVKASPKYSQQTSHSWPMRASYGMSVVSSKSNQFPPLPIIMFYTCNITPCYNRLSFVRSKSNLFSTFVVACIMKYHVILQNHIIEILLYFQTNMYFHQIN